MTEAAAPRPLPHPTCPLCGAANQCAPASAGTFSVDCWCTGASISTESLSRVPVAMRGKACLCASCARVEHRADES